MIPRFRPTRFTATTITFLTIVTTRTVCIIVTIHHRFTDLLIVSVVSNRRVGVVVHIVSTYMVVPIVMVIQDVVVGVVTTPTLGYTPYNGRNPPSCCR